MTHTTGTAPAAARPPAGSTVRPPNGASAGAASPRAQARGAKAAASAPQGSSARKRLSRTPGKLQLLAALAVLACLLFGAMGLWAASLQATALADAGGHATQVAGVESVRSTLVAADADATNAFLVGGLEPAGERAAYDQQIEEAATSLAVLAGQDAADAETLGQVNADLAEYSALVAQARANNRQGFPVGAAYLEQASNTLRTEILPALDRLIVANANRAADAFALARGAAWILATAVVILVALIIGQIWIARRTHRYLNLGLLGASVIVLVAGLVAAGILGGANSSAASVRRGPYAATLASSQAFALANDAKSMESFTLIKRGSGQAYEDAYGRAVADANQRLDRARAQGVIDDAAGKHLRTWQTLHREIRAADDAGNWDRAVSLATATGAGTSTEAFDAYAKTAREDIAGNSARTVDRLDDARSGVTLAGWLMLLAGILAAAFAWRGVGARLKEYR